MTQLGSELSTVVEAGSGMVVVGWLVGGAFVLFGLHLVAGRFLVKARRKKSQAYVLTSERAIVLKRSGEVAQRLARASVSTERSRDGRHGTVRFTQAARAMVSGAFENSGLELFARGGEPVAFYDVADPDELFEALRTVA